MNYKNISQTFDKQQKITPHCDPVSRLLGMYEKDFDEDGIRTHACRAHWISSPTP